MLRTIWRRKPVPSSRNSTLAPACPSTSTRSRVLTGLLTLDPAVWNELKSCDPSRWRDLLDLARSAPSRDATGIAAGVMDAVYEIRPDDRAEALEQGLTWGSGTVRLAALPGVARFHGIEQARVRASADPSEKVRAWPNKQRPTLLLDPSPDTSVHVPRATVEPQDDPTQPNLFGNPDRGAGAGC